MKVYIVNIENNYGDKSIAGVWTTRDKAEKWIQINSQKPEYFDNLDLVIDEYELDKAVE